MPKMTFGAQGHAFIPSYDLSALLILKCENIAKYCVCSLEG
jgi:hypothetical protein